jgi:hypothetical protein
MSWGSILLAVLSLLGTVAEVWAGIESQTNKENANGAKTAQAWADKPSSDGEFAERLHAYAKAHPDHST